MVSYTEEYVYIETNTNKKCWYQWHMWPKKYTNFNTPPQGGPNMHPVNVRAQIMLLKTTGNYLGYLTYNPRGKKAQD